MSTAVVLGGSGFVGARCLQELRAAGWEARSEPSPRLATAARRPDELRATLAGEAEVVDALAEALDDADVVVNSGGMAISNAPASDELFGANALLPAVVSLAAGRAGARRVIHLSSISVQGRMDPLDESMRHNPNSPYSASRALGEQLLQGPEHRHTVIFRLPGVHAAERSVTRKLNWIARSPLSCTAGPPPRPTPLMLLDNVAAALVFLAEYAGEVPLVVLPPADGVTTDGILELLGGRKPRHIPVRVAAPVVSLLMLTGRRSPGVYALGRRLELLWFGQGQVPGWLTEVGFRPPVGPEGWAAIGRASSAQR